MALMNKDRMIKYFLDLVDIDCESYFEAPLADYIKDSLDQLEIDYYEDQASEQLKQVCFKTMGMESNPANNIYVCLEGNLPDKEKNKEYALLLSAHMDTVHPGIGKQAIIHENGTITSDGTTILGADDLSGIAQMLEILTIMKETDLPHPDLEFLFTAAEEPFCQGSRLVEYDRLHAKYALVLDLGGPIGRAAYQAPGIYSLSIHVHGKASHAGSAPEKGIHALLIAARAIAALPQGKVDEETTVNIGTIQGGTDKNVIPEDIYMTGEIRTMKKERAAYWAKEIKKVFKEEADILGGTVDVQVDKEFDAYSVSHESLVTRVFVDAVRALDLTPDLMVTYGGSDCNNFNDYGIEGLVIANGMNNLHSTGEYADVEDMTNACMLLLKYIELLSES